MDPSKRATDTVVVEACTCKRLLGVTVTAAWSQRVVMDVITLVAANAQLRESLQHATARVALFTEQSVVGSTEPRWKDVVAGVDLLPRRRFVTALAANA